MIVKKKHNKKFAMIMICVFALTSVIWPEKANAAGEYATISGGGNANIGDKITVSVNMSCDSSVWGVKGTVSYDPAVLEFVSASGATVNGGGGQVSFSESYTNKNSSAVITFKAVGVGNASVSLAECTIASEENGKVNCSGGKASVSVKAASANTDNNNNTNNNNNNNNTDNTKGNAKLASLAISPGKLQPAFSANTFTYVVEVEDGVTALTVSAKTQDSSSKVKSVNGSKSIEHGENVVTVVTEAEDGTSLTYKLKVYCGVKAPGSENEDTTKATDQTITVNGADFVMAAEIPENSIPEGFTKKTVSYNGKEVAVVKNDTLDVTLAYLKSTEDDKADFYVYEEATGSFYPFHKIELADKKYIVLLQPDPNKTIPGNMILTTTDVLGEVFYVCKSNDEKDADFVYFYSVNQDGTRGWYRYDTADGTYQRFDFTSMENANQAAADAKAAADKQKLLMIIAFVVAGIMTIIAVVFIVLFVRKKGMNPEDDFDDDFLYDDEDEEDILAETSTKSAASKEEIKEEAVAEEKTAPVEAAPVEAAPVEAKAEETEASKKTLTETAEIKIELPPEDDYDYKFDDSLPEDFEINLEDEVKAEIKSQEETAKAEPIIEAKPEPKAESKPKTKAPVKEFTFIDFDD